jgi:hypothetical protein
MKKTTTAVAAAVLAGALAVPALADVEVLATIDKTKDITVTEDITIHKTVILFAEVDLQLHAAAEAMAIANITNKNNLVDRASALISAGNAITKNAEIKNSIGDYATQAGNRGIVGVNQDVGNMVNQANLVAFALTGDEDAFTDAQAEVDQRNGGADPGTTPIPTGNTVQWGADPGPPNAADPILLTALIDTSISYNLGVVGVNQNAGNMNNQTNAVAVAAGIDFGPRNNEGPVGGTTPPTLTGAVALAESALGQENSNNLVNEINATKKAEIKSSLNFNKGIVGTNQSTGNNGNQANVVSVAVSLQ